MIIAVSGAGGMIGSACVRRFLDRGHRVLALNRAPKHGVAVVHEGLEVAQLDEVLDDPARLRGVNALVHLAAMREEAGAEAVGARRYQAANVALTGDLAAAGRAAGVGVFCLASSIAVYSLDNEPPFRETDTPRPASAYGASKLAAERKLAGLMEAEENRWVSLRLAQVIGPDRNRLDGLLMTWIELARRGEPLTVFGDGSGTRDYICIADVVTAFERALEPGGPSGVFNIGGGAPVTVRRLAETINRVFANPAGVRFLPEREDSNDTGYMSCRRAETELRWSRGQSLEEGLVSLRDSMT